VATDDTSVNDWIGQEAASRGVLVNRTDASELGNVTFPAHAHHGPVTIAVHTGGISASASASIRRELSEALDSAWPQFLETLSPYRRMVQDSFTDARKRQYLLAQMASQEAMTTFKNSGALGLKAYCDRIIMSAKA